jgi:phosphinothricin acetyltransferase
MKIRAALETDLPEILQIYNEAVLTTTATYDYEPRTLASQQAWFADHLQTGYPVFVADGDQGVAGWSSLSRYHTRYGYRFTAENSIYVAADRRGQGIGKQLMVPLIQSARQMGLRAILAGIDAENQASLRLHTHFGFEPVAHFKQIGYKFDRWLDVIFLELLLSKA